MKIHQLPMINNMILLICDECGSSTLNLFMGKDFKTLAFKCLSCNYIGYMNVDEEEES